MVLFQHPEPVLHIITSLCRFQIHRNNYIFKSHLRNYNIVGRMLKIFSVLAIMVVLSASALADISMVTPFEEGFSDQEVFKLGTVAQGENFEIIISNETGLGDEIRWDEFSVNTDTLPLGWIALSTNKGERRV